MISTLLPATVSQLLFGVKCPFCQHRPALSPNEDQTLSCASCSSTFARQPDNTLETVYTPRMKGVDHQLYSSVSTHSSNQGVLCATCNHHQTVLIDLLSSYDFEDDDQHEDTDVVRRGLMERYPLCTGCEWRVGEKLKQVEFRVRCSRLGGARLGAKKSKISRGKVDYRKLVANSSDVLCNSALIICIRSDCSHLSTLFSAMNGVFQIIFRPWKPRNICVSIFVLVARIALALAAFDLAAYVRLTISIVLYSSVILFDTANPIQVMQKIGTLSTRVTNKENFANLSISSQPSPNLAKPRNPFQFNKRPAQSSSSVVKLRPTILDHRSQSSGLEDAFLHSFSLASPLNIPQKKSVLPSFHSNVNFIRQLILFSLLSILRIWAENRMPLVVITLAMGFTLGHYRVMHFERIRSAFAVLIACRLICLGLAAGRFYFVPLPPYFYIFTDILLIFGSA